MDNKIKFSVIFPIYKKVSPKIFKISFDSILNQSLMPNELIVIYDGPVHQNIKNYINKKKRKFKIIKILNFPTNNGLGYVLKRAINYSTSDYIARCDADDISFNNRFKDQINFISKNRNIDVLSSNVLESHKNKIYKKNVPEKHSEIKKKIFYRNPINHSSVILKKNTILKVGNYEDVRFFEDYFLWYKIKLYKGKFYNLQNYHVKMNVDNEYYVRRSGYKYFLYYLNFLNKLKSRKMIGYLNYFINIILRFNVIYLPTYILSKIYNIFLRS